MEKKYNHELCEEKNYKLWEDSGYFNPDNLPEGESYTVVLPPPNVTGKLHMGHAAMLAYQDALVRFNRMRGKKTLWLPGTDHAAIATANKTEKIIYEKEGKTRHDLGRDLFLERVHQFAKDNHDTIINQVKKMGASLDWSREAFTLDEERSLAVRTAFKRMYDDGLIYQGARIVNWDPFMQTTVSDDEIEYKEEKTSFYYLQFGPFVIATSRPETKLGDKYVVMHPDDRRYKKYEHGQKITVEWINGEVIATVIKDDVIDPEFGTGVMTITPWHDNTDFEIAERHNLEKEQIIGFDGKMLPIAKEFEGLKIKKARALVVEKLREKGLVVKVEENYTHRVALNSRGGGVIEPQIKKQWFVDVNKKFNLSFSKIKGFKTGDEVSLKELMQKVVETGEVKIFPDRFNKIYYQWIDNLHNWCISRQIWYGHQIPVWYKEGETYCDINPPQEEGWEQDPDTLDTWFSSGLWTFSTLGWPKETEDLKKYHPTDVLETGYDILFFWVARMILMTTYNLGEIPFKNVYLHGMVRDGKGKKMSKSLGNTIDPLDMVDEYGADATRLSLVIGSAPGNDIKLSEDKIRGYRNFANKIWNISRFIMMRTEDYDNSVTEKDWSDEDKAIYSEFVEAAKETTKNLEEFKFSLSAETIYHYIWHTFADKVLEDSKSVLDDESRKKTRQDLLRRILLESLKVMHPFMPYVTEEIYQRFPFSDKKETLMIEEWPVL
ncbi:MAG: valine--tRNA ligase [Candidatus Pacebacteria bacterium]|nr:valine--tRNA ligase [Candidatus Paceibacterota bacterium]